MHVQGQEDVLEIRERFARTDDVGTKAIESDVANPELEFQVIDEIGAVVPHARVLMAGTDEVVVRVAHVDEAVPNSLVGDRRQRTHFIRARRKFAVQPVHRELVVVTDPLHVGVGQIDVAVVVDLRVRSRIVHDAFAAVGAGHVVVREADRVPDFVSGELTDPGQRHFHGVGVGRDLREVVVVRRVGELAQLAVLRRGDPGRERRHHALAVQVVLTQAQAAEVDDATNDLARAGIDHRVAVRVPAGPPVRPVDHVVADVLRVYPLRKHPHLESVDEARRLERLIPPRRAFDQRGANRLRRSGVDVVDDRLDRPRHRRVRIDPLEAMPR